MESPSSSQICKEVSFVDPLPEHQITSIIIGTPYALYCTSYEVTEVHNNFDHRQATCGGAQASRGQNSLALAVAELRGVSRHKKPNRHIRFDPRG
jgi:hypothetical protein